MSNLEIVNVYKDVILNGVSYCKLCLRTEKERNMVKPRAILNFLKDVPMYQIDDISICYMCEAHAASALLFVQRLEFATSAELFFRAMKCVNSLSLDNVVKIEGQDERTLHDLAMDCESRLCGARARSRLAMTDVLLVHGGKIDDEQQAPVSNSQASTDHLNISSDVTPSTPEISVKPIKPQNKPNGKRTRPLPPPPPQIAVKPLAKEEAAERAAAYRAKLSEAGAGGRDPVNGDLGKAPQNLIETVIVIDDEDSVDDKATQTETRTNDRRKKVVTYGAAEVTNTSVPVTNKTNASTTNNNPKILNFDFVTNSISPLNNIVPIIDKGPQIVNNLISAINNPLSITNNDVSITNSISRIIVIPNASNTLFPGEPYVVMPEVTGATNEVLSIDQMLTNKAESTFDTAILTPDGTKLIIKDKICNNYLAHAILTGKDGHSYIPTLTARLVNNQFEYVSTEVIEKNLGIIKVVTPNEINRNNIRVRKDLNEIRHDNNAESDRIRVDDQNDVRDLDTLLKEKANELQRRRHNHLDKREYGGKRLKNLLESPRNATSLQNQNKQAAEEDWCRNASVEMSPPQNAPVERNWTQNAPDVRNWRRNDTDDKKWDRNNPRGGYPGEKRCNGTTRAEKRINNNSEVKRPILTTGRIDWEDKIPMDVISFVDAVDPNADDLIVPDNAERSIGVISEVRSVCVDDSDDIL